MYKMPRGVPLLRRLGPLALSRLGQRRAVRMVSPERHQLVTAPDRSQQRDPVKHVHNKALIIACRCELGRYPSTRASSKAVDQDPERGRDRTKRTFKF